MAYNQITLPNDPLNLLTTALPAGTTIAGTLDFPVGGGATTGTINLQLAGVTIPGETFTGFTSTLSGTTYTLTSATNILGQFVRITYNTTTPNIAPTIAVVQTVPLLPNVTLATATNATVSNPQLNVPCFAAGTLIRTSRGEVAVEDLRVGDMVETASGKSRRIVWLGHSDIDIRLQAHPIAYQPIRIAVDAFGQGAPYRDLTVSPGHGLCVCVLDEVIMPAVVLVNGTTITQLDEDHVTYWHVELEAHDIMYANGLPAESYINVGNRTFFGDGVNHVDPVRTLADYCRPYVSEGILVTAMREQLKLRSEKLGWRCDVTPFADIHLEADGARIEPTVEGLTARFDLPGDAGEVWLVSAASVPAHVLDSHDKRRLGILLRSLRIEDEVLTREIALDDPSLCVGFHAAEGADDDVQRWTTGRARLPASLWAESRGDLVIQIELASPGLPKWTAPAEPETKPARDGKHLSLVAAA